MPEVCDEIVQMFAPVYLDFNATTPLDQNVLEAMLPWLGVRFGNPSSRHEYGRQARAAIDEARARVARAVGAHASEVTFTSGGSEANNLMIKGFAALMKPGRIAISAIEHPCVREPARQLKRQGWQVDEIGVDGAGLIDGEAWQTAIANRPALVSVMLANNETGVLQDVGRLATESRGVGAVFHTDAVQAVSKLPVEFRALAVDAMTISAHKLGGPLGVGALVLNKRVELAPLIAGGGQEHGLRSGTENVAAIVGFGMACERVMADREKAAVMLAGLRESLESRLIEMGAVLFSAAAPRLPNTSFFAFDGIEGETLVGKLDRAGFACASGSACSSANPEPSHTLLAMGVAPELARNAVRVSLGRTTTPQEVDDFATTLRRLTTELRNMAAIAV